MSVTPPTHTQIIWVISAFKAVILKPEALQKKPIRPLVVFLCQLALIGPNFGLKLGHSAL